MVVVVIYLKIQRAFDLSDIWPTYVNINITSLIWKIKNDLYKVANLLWLRPRHRYLTPLASPRHLGFIRTFIKLEHRSDNAAARKTKSQYNICHFICQKLE